MASDGACSPSPREIDEFLIRWLADHVERPGRFEFLNDLAQQCREAAREAGISPLLIEERLGATIEEAIVEVVNGMRLEERTSEERQLP